MAVAIGVTGMAVGGNVVRAADVGTENLTDKKTAAPEAWGATPSPNQYRYQKEELAAFCHFGPNTFSGYEWGFDQGKQQWLYKGIDPTELFPLADDFDAETLVKTLQDAGFKKLIVTAKHHDGFCIWASDYTTYDVASSNYKNGQGDILAEISAACTKCDMDMGLYLSPWDVAEPSYGYFDENGNSLCDANGNPKNGKTWEEVYELDAKDYNEYYDNQLAEILSNDKYGNNGHFVEVWMDGAKGEHSKPQNYDFIRWFETIQKYEGKEAGYEDDCMLFGAEAYTTVRWIGNENGLAAEETWSKSKTDKTKNTIDSNSTGGYTKGFADGNQWTVPEADARITSGWFWGSGKSTPKTLDELSNMYFNSVGHNATLLLNVPPNKQGKVDQAILDRVKEFGQNIAESFDDNLAKEATVTATEVRGNDVAFSPANVLDGDDATYWTMEDGTTTGSLTLDLGKTKTFDLVTIEEAIQLGQRISSFTVEYQLAGGEWKPFAEGTTIGAKRICRDKQVKADKVKINITGSHAVPLISEVGLYKASEEFELASPIPEGLDVISVTDKDTSDGEGFAYTGWTAEQGNQFIEGNSMYAGSGVKATLTFTGTKVWLYGTKDTSHGTADIYIDDKKVDSINTKAGARATGQMIYESPDLKDEPHVLRIENTGTIGLDAAAVLNNGGKGMVQFENKTLTMEEDTVEMVTVKRVGGHDGEIRVDYENNPGSAVQGNYDVDGIRGTIVFADGETEKTIKVVTKRDKFVKGDLNFTVDLIQAGGGAVLGFQTTLKVTIRDMDDSARLDEAKEILQQAQTLLDNQYGVEGTDAVRTLTKELKAYLAAQEQTEMITVGDIMRTAVSLQRAMAQISVSSKFVLPVGTEKKTVEAELFTLDSTQAANPNNYVRITDHQNASGKKEVNWFEEGNKISLPFYAPKAGNYLVKATYRSGRIEEDKNPNAFNWSGTNIESGSQDVYGEASAETFHTVQLTVNVTAAGAGELVFTADSKGGPVIDKFEFECEDKTPAQAVAVTGVTLDKETLKLTDDNPYAVLVETVIPANATNKSVTFTSSDVSVATVDENGLVRAVSKGQAVITVTTEDGKKTAQCQVTSDVTFAEQKKLEELQKKVQELEAVLAAGRGNYSEATWAEFVKAYNAAKALDVNAGMDAIEKCLADLQAARDGLKQEQSPEPQPQPQPKPQPDPKPQPQPQPQPEIQEGQVYEDGDYSYKVTSLEKLTAEVVGVNKKGMKTAKIYNTVTLGGKNYKITAVAPSLFKNYKKITSLVIGKNVQTIGKNAFAGCVDLKKVTVNSKELKQIGSKAFFNCKKLKTLTIKSKKLKSVGRNAFKGIHKKAVIKVPAAKWKAYKKLLAKKGQSRTVKIKK